MEVERISWCVSSRERWQWCRCFGKNHLGGVDPRGGACEHIYYATMRDWTIKEPHNEITHRCKQAYSSRVSW